MVASGATEYFKQHNQGKCNFKAVKGGISPPEALLLAGFLELL